MEKKILNKLMFKPTKHLLKRIGLLSSPPAKRDIFQELPWMSETSFGNLVDADSTKSNSVTWFIPPVGKGSGGHLNVFRFVRMLEEQGFDCRIVICHDPRRIAADTARQEIADFFFPLKAQVLMHPGALPPPTEFAIATGWQTAYVVRAFQSCRQRLYFVQDFEPWFHEASSLYAFAEATYLFGFTAITAGNWLADLLTRNYGMQTYAIGFGVDHQLYKPSARPPHPGKHIFFYVRPPTARRGFELGLFALALLSRRIPDLTVHLAGWPMKNYHIPFRHVDYGILQLEELASLYAHCDAALVLSFSNLSLLPLEIMACGCPVVSNTGENVKWLLNTDNALLVSANPESVAEGLEHILTNPTLYKRLRDAGISFTRNLSWEHEGERMANLIENIGAFRLSRVEVQ